MVVFEFYIVKFLGHVIGMHCIFIACASIEGCCLPAIFRMVDLQGHHCVMFLVPLDEQWANLDKSAARVRWCGSVCKLFEGINRVLGVLCWMSIKVCSGWCDW